jgi:chromosomal replication initiation ATPase DnaA
VKPKPAPWEILASLKRFPERWRLAEKVCDDYRVSVEGALCYQDRHPRATRARHRFLALMKWSTDLSYPEVGRMIGVDHTTVMLACEKVELLLMKEYPRSSSRDP